MPSAGMLQRVQLQLTAVRDMHYLTVAQKEINMAEEREQKLRFTKKVRRGLGELYPSMAGHLSSMIASKAPALLRHDVEAALDWVAQVSLAAK